MALAVTNDASAFKRSANVPAQTAFTIWGWFNFSSVTPARFWGPLGIYNGTDGTPSPASNFIQISSAASGSANLELVWDTGGGSGSTSAALFTASANTWYFLALSCSALSAGNLKAYVRALTANAFTTAQNSSAPVAFTPNRMEWGRDAFLSDFISGSLHACGAADRALSADELLKLSYFHEPQLQGIASLNCFYPTIESVNSNATVDRSGNARNATATVGALTDSPALLWREISGSMNLPGAGSANVTLALTGVAGTGGVGTFGIAHDQALTGAAGTGSPGTLAVNHSQAITGNAGTGAAGSVTPSSAVALSGNAAAGQVGSLGPAGDGAAALSGNAATGAVGTFGVSHAQAITGNAATAAVGTLAPSTTLALTGNAATGAAGTMAPSTTLGLSGNAATGAVGTFGVSHAQTITGNAATTAVGTLAPSTASALSGNAGTGAAGTMAPAATIGLSGNAATGAVGTLGTAGSGAAALSGVSGTGGVGSMGVGTSEALTGVSSSAAVGTLAPRTAAAITGNAAAGQVGTLTPVIQLSTQPLTGVSATGSVGTMTPSTSGQAPVSDADVPDWFAFFRAQPAVTALVSDRIYPNLIPHHVYTHVTQNPVIVFSRISGERDANYCGTEVLLIGRYQFDCYARTYEAALALGEALRLSLRDFVGLIGAVRIRLTRCDNEFELLDPEPGLFRISSDWSIWYHESVS